AERRGRRIAPEPDDPRGLSRRDEGGVSQTGNPHASDGRAGRAVETVSGRCMTASRIGNKPVFLSTVPPNCLKRAKKSSGQPRAARLTSTGVVWGEYGHAGQLAERRPTTDLDTDDPLHMAVRRSGFGADGCAIYYVS